MAKYSKHFVKCKEINGEFMNSPLLPSKFNICPKCGMKNIPLYYVKEGPPFSQILGSPHGPYLAFHNCPEGGDHMFIGNTSN